jgi:PAS domain S-box-containing protein
MIPQYERNQFDTESYGNKEELEFLNNELLFYKRQFKALLNYLNRLNISFCTVELVSKPDSGNSDKSNLKLYKANDVFAQYVGFDAGLKFPLFLRNKMVPADWETFRSVLEECVLSEEQVFIFQRECSFTNGACKIYVYKLYPAVFSVLVVKDDESQAVNQTFSESDVLHLLCNALPFGLWVKDSAGKFIFANDRAARDLFGKNSGQELSGQSIESLLGEMTVDTGTDYIEQCKKTDTEVLSKGKALTYYTDRTNQNISEVWKAPFRDKRGKIKGVISTSREVTEQLNKDKLLKRQKHQLSESQRIAKVGSWELNFDTGLMLWSEEFLTILGFEPVETSIKILPGFARLISEEQRRSIYEKYKSIFNSSLSLYKSDVVIRNRWGREMIISDIGRVVRDDAGRPLRLYATIQDITENRRTHDELRRSREKLLSLLNALPDRVYLINRDGVFTEYYDNIPGIAQRVEDNFTGYRVNDVFSHSMASRFVEYVHLTLDTQQPQSFEYSEGEGLFERWFEVRSSACNQNEVVFLIREITQTRKSTYELLRAKTRAEESDRLKSAFLANISHEIRTPLNAMMGFANILAEEDITTEEKERYLSIINRNADQLTSLFSDLLDISKIESGQLKIFKESVNINSELDKLFAQFNQLKKGTIKEGVDLRLQKFLDDDEAVIITDQTRFIQIFSNLLSNALKFTESGFVEFGYKKTTKGRLSFYVKDSGTGIPYDELQNIFIRFRQSTHNNVKKHGGTGLGLAICESLLNLMGGRIWVESEFGHGSVFWFTLPY